MHTQNLNYFAIDCQWHRAKAGRETILAKERMIICEVLVLQDAYHLDDIDELCNVVYKMENGNLMKCRGEDI